MEYLNDMTDFQEISKEQYRAALENLDQDGEGKQVQIEDIKRVLKKYGKMTNQQIDHFISINNEEDDAKLADIYGGIIMDEEEPINRTIENKSFFKDISQIDIV